MILSTPYVESVVEIINKKGLHARAAAWFVKTSERFSARIWISDGQQLACGKSIMGLMMMGVICGQSIHIYAQGDDAEEAMEALVNLVHEKFYET